IMISGRPPVTNMYESVVWVSCIAALFALILECVYRQRYYIVGVAPLSVVLLILADQFPAVLDSSIGPLTPVLRENFWLSVLVPLHVRLAGWMSDFALSVSSVVCFLPVLMAWYGVNFVLGKGLHSYGFGVGGYWYAVAFVAIELAFVGAATWRRSRIEAEVVQ